MKRKLYISKSLNMNPKKVELVSAFCLFCCQKLPIEGPFEVHLVSDREPHGIKTTASYHVEDNKIYIYGRERAVVDILRSIAHEMTHMMQNEMGLINGPVQDIGGFHEDQANSRAGQMIKLYARDKEEGSRIYERKKS